MIQILSKCVKAVWLFPTWLICRLFPVNQIKIVVSNFYGRGYGDNPKYIIEKLLESTEKFKIIWLIKNDAEKSTLPEGVEACRINSIRSIYHLSTAKIWIDNCRKGFVMFKRKNQLYIQTWHGFALKRIEQDVIENLSKKYIQNAKSDSKKIDLIISDSSFMTDIYKSHFWYNGNVVEIGSPRNDIIINTHTSLKEKIFNEFNINTNKKLILYAPTFRADGSNAAYSLDYNNLIIACKKKFGEDFSVLVRLHPNVVKNSKFMKFDGVNIINASFYPDMQELLAAVDIVITDYSSLMFDFALSYKPCFQFALDIDEYKKDRNFYFDIYNLPFMLAKSNEELVNNILSFDEKQYKTKLEEFYDSVGMIMSGSASRQCADIILNFSYPNK